MRKLRKATGRKHPRTKAMRAAAIKAISVGLPKPSEVHITLYLVLDAGHGDTGANVCPAGFHS